MVIGILAVQGDIAEHGRMLTKLSEQWIPVHHPEDLQHISGLILPGGESTTIGKLLRSTSLDIAIKKYKLPMYGTCAGAILLANHITHSDQVRLGLVNIQVHRNSYGSQLHSFEMAVHVIGWNKPFPGVFIRAPEIHDVGTNVSVLASCNNSPVLVRTENILISTFHPELTEDLRVHKYFLNMVRGDLK